MAQRVTTQYAGSEAQAFKPSEVIASIFLIVIMGLAWKI